jgi:hypothetical protein
MQATTTFLVSELWPDRYGVGRTKIYEFLKRLDITPFKPEGDKRGHITFEQLQDLDSYVDTLGKEGPERAEEFIQKRLQKSAQLSAATHTDTSANTSTPTNLPALPPAMEALVSALAHRLQPEPAPDIFAPQRQLEEAWRYEWTLTSKQLQQIIGAKPVEGKPRYGFKLEKIARGWWRLEKIRS